MKNSLATAIDNLKNRDEITSFLNDILTANERKVIEQRWQIAQMLSAGASYKEIEATTGASSATISKVNEFVQYGNGGYKLALNRSLANAD